MAVSGFRLRAPFSACDAALYAYSQTNITRRGFRVRRTAPSSGHASYDIAAKSTMGSALLEIGTITLRQMDMDETLIQFSTSPKTHPEAEQGALDLLRFFAIEYWTNYNIQLAEFRSLDEPPELPDGAYQGVPAALEAASQRQTKPKKRGGKSPAAPEDADAIQQLRARGKGVDHEDIYRTWHRKATARQRKLSNPRNSFRQLRRKAFSSESE